MTELSHTVSATLTLSLDSDFSFSDLPRLVSAFLAQADVRPAMIDLAFRGDDVVYHTREGSIEVAMRRAESGRATIRVSCDTLVRGTRETGRQICFQLVKRLIARCNTASVYWHPTRQTLPSAQFRWDSLMDLPQRFVPPKVHSIVMPPTGSLA